MDMSFSFRGKSRRWRRRERLEPTDLHRLFARIAARQAVSATALVQAGLTRGVVTLSPFEQRVALFAGGPARRPTNTCASFACRPAHEATSSTIVKPPFTLALQRSFKPARLERDAAELNGAVSPVSRPA